MQRTIAILLTILLLLLTGCISDPREAADGSETGRAYVNLSFSMTGDAAQTRVAGSVSDDGIRDVLTEGNTTNEAQVHTVLVAMFDAAGSDSEKTLKHLFWFADDTEAVLSALSVASLSGYESNRLSVMGTLALNAAGTRSTSSTKALWPGWYHTVVYGNLLTPHLLTTLLGTTTSGLMAMTQEQVAAKGVTLQAFRMAFSKYATGPMSQDVGQTQPLYVNVKVQGATNTTFNELIGGYADNVKTAAEATTEGTAAPSYYHQSYYENLNLNIPKGYSETSPFVQSMQMKRALAKIRVNFTNIEEAGMDAIFEGTDAYYLNADHGIVVKNWIPFGPNMQWQAYDITPATPTAYSVQDKSGTTAATGYYDLNVSWSQLDYTSSETYPYDRIASAANGDVDSKPYTYSEALKLPLQYYLSRGNKTYKDAGGNAVALNVQTGAIAGRASTKAGAYNAELFNCYIAAWSPLFAKQTATENPTTIQITMEKRDAANQPIAGSERVYEIPLYNPDSDPVAATDNLMDSHSYLRDGDYSAYTILRNYLYEVDVVFMGEAGLEWKIRAVPDDWIPDEEENLDFDL